MFKHLATLLAASVLVAAGVAASMSLAGNGSPSTTTVTDDTAKKVFVCKYVGAPGIDERLQTGQNPISVSVNAIPEDPVVIGSFFADAQGRSFVLAFDVGQPEPSVDECPSPEEPPPPTGTTPTDTTPTTTTPTTPTETTPTTPGPRCPAGQGPFAGKDGDETEPGHNQECCPDSNNDQKCDTAAVTPRVVTKTEPTTTSGAPSVTTPAASAAPQPQAKVRTSSRKYTAPKPKRQPKLTGNPKKDKCKNLGDGTLRCKGVVVIPANG